MGDVIIILLVLVSFVVYYSVKSFEKAKKNLFADKDLELVKFIRSCEIRIIILLVAILFQNILFYR